MPFVLGWGGERMKSTIGHCIISHMLKKCCRERD